ncbi:hypothetical protein [Psychrobacillus phage Perkons]|nr:hypothetical protein [Psychrobacillus phage Perkons]
MNLKYKIDDEVVITNNHSEHEFVIGDVVTIKELYNDGTKQAYYVAERNDDKVNWWAITDYDVV